MKEIILTHAEVIPFYGKDEVIQEVKLEKGTILNYNVKTKVNDSAAKSPVIFDRCSSFLNSQDKIDNLKKIIAVGNIVNIKGSQTRTKSKDGAKYFDNINVIEIVPIIDQNPEPKDELPF